MKRLLLWAVLLWPISVTAQLSNTCTGANLHTGNIVHFPADHKELLDSGYCYTIDPSVNTFVYCFRIVALCDSLYSESAYDTIDANCTTAYVSNYDYYSYPGCSFLSSGMALGGLTAGDTIVLCITGVAFPFSCDGYTDICPYTIHECNEVLWLQKERVGANPETPTRRLNGTRNIICINILGQVVDHYSEYFHYECIKDSCYPTYLK